jgi:uncharacterized flavoprotein (TIGR03862 family)
MESSHPPCAAVIGGGPAGLMAAETLRVRGVSVDLYDRMASVGRKLLIAGKGGLNLTHSEPLPAFLGRYGNRDRQVGSWLRSMDADGVRRWAAGLGVDTMIGSSGRVFPRDLKAAPLLRGWLRRLRASGVRFHVQHRCLGWTAEGALRLHTADGEVQHRFDAVVLALGGGSWAKLGSDGAWVQWLPGAGVEVRPLRPANCGFEVAWSLHFAERHAGAPLKPIALRFRDSDGGEHARQGEMLVTRHGLEGSLIYALAAPLRDTIAATGSARIELDLAPGRSEQELIGELARPADKRTLSEQLRRRAGISGARAALLRECVPAAQLQVPEQLASAIKCLPIVLRATRPIDEAISSAGGVALESVDERLMLIDRPGVFCCGEMLDWEAPTGGYLLTACLASGRVAGHGAADWLSQQGLLEQPMTQ